MFNITRNMEHFAPARLLNNYWMRSSRIWGIIKGWGLCYLPKPKAEADNTNRGLNNSSYPTRTEFSNFFIIYLYLQTFLLKKPAICIFRI